MKKIVSKLMFLASLAIAFAGCDDNMGDTDNRLAASNGIIEPADGTSVVLETSASASTYFEWEYVNPEEAGTVIYQIAFDTESGDFSKPIYMLYSDNNGLKNCATNTALDM